ncbi:MAG: protein-disulfide reductase DsbD [Gammaproteobacteria bacterium]|nr:protein-disulfide reductase DsbD [Gammaproteobacteria bacterium]
MNKFTISSLMIFMLLMISGNGIILAAESSSSTFQDTIFEEEEEFLKVDDAFIVSADSIDNEFIVRWKIAEAYYLYKHRFGFSAIGAELNEPLIPDGLKKTDEYFGKVEVYYNHVEIAIPFKKASNEVILTIEYQGCADAGLCYTPTTRYLTFEEHSDGSYKLTSGIETKISGLATLESEAAISPKNEPSNFTSTTGTLSSVLAEGDVFWTLLAFLGAGLLLTFTPCVLPMIPILSGIIAGQGKEITTAKAFRLSFVYVQAMAITYAVLGVLVAKAGNSLSGYLQSPIILTIVAGIFIILAMSMFGLFEVKLPAFIGNRIQDVSEKQKGGNYIGVAVMGVISTLIVSPCTSAPLTAALLFIAKSGNVWMGGLSLYFLGLGMGIPLLIIGVSEGRLIPKAGEWMDSVKLLFGFIMLGMSLYITAHLIPGPVYLLLWSILLIIASNFFGACTAATNPGQILRKSIAIIIFLIGIIYMLGAAMGNDRLLQPLGNIHVSSSSKAENSDLDFVPFKSLEELEVHLKTAKQLGQPVMVDFFAEWCVACYEFEDYTFSNEKVKQLLATKNVILLQADVTLNSAIDIQLMKNFNILGLPSILFFDTEGSELTQMRATGFEDAETFMKRLNSAFK